MYHFASHKLFFHICKGYLNALQGTLNAEAPEWTVQIDSIQMQICNHFRRYRCHCFDSPFPFAISESWQGFIDFFWSVAIPALGAVQKLGSTVLIRKWGNTRMWRRTRRIWSLHGIFVQYVIVTSLPLTFSLFLEVRKT